VDAWEIKTGGQIPVSEIFAENNQITPGVSAAISNDSLWLAAGLMDRLVLWQPDTGLPVLSMPIYEPPEKILFTPGDQNLLTLGRGALRLWRQSDLNLVSTLSGYENYAGAVVSPDRRMLAVELPEGGVRILQIQNGLPLATLGRGHAVRPLGFSPDNQHLAILSNQLQIWWVSGELDYSLEIPGVQAISPGWDTLLAFEGKTVKMHSLPDGKEVWSREFSRDVQGVAFLPGGVVMIDTAEDYIFVNTAERRELYSFPAGSSLDRMVYSPDRRYLVYTWDLDAEVRRVFDGAQIASFPLDDTDSRFDFTDDSRYLAASTRFGLHLINPANGQEFLFQKDCSAARFSPDDSRLLCYNSSSDRLLFLPVARLSESTELQPELSDPAGINDGIVNFWFLPDENQVLVLSQDGTARLWEFP
jgi:WD40 repeat protein